MVTETTDPLNGLLLIRDGSITARWNYIHAVGDPLATPGGIGEAVALTYSFPVELPGYYLPSSDFVPFSEAQRQAALAVMADMAEIIGVSFTAAPSGNDGAITFAMDYQGGPNGDLGYAMYPAFESSYWDTPPYLVFSVQATGGSGDVWLNKDIGWVAADFDPNGTGYGTLIHELGHSLGLKHPFEAYSANGYVLDPTLDNRAYTVMSYSVQSYFRVVFDGVPAYIEIQPETLMPLDIAALQYLYGANLTTRSGNDTYTFAPDRPFLKTIWDGGGTDTISVANFTLGCAIDLRPGAHSSIRIPSVPLPEGWMDDPEITIYDGTDNLAIAYGVTIERAIGGSGNDELLGNQAANLLDGGVGDDTMSGDAGKDTLKGGAGTDSLDGGGGADLLDGGSGADRLSGGSGNDTYILDSAADVVSEHTGAGTDTVKAGFTHVLGASSNLERLILTGSGPKNGTGNELNNTLTGNRAANRLYGLEGSDTLSGGGGADILDGGTGADRLSGGAGNDTYIVDSPADVITENSGAGTDTVKAGVTWLLGNNLEKLVLTGTGASDGTGNGLNNTLAGNAGANTLSGEAGDDTVAGGGGSDTLYGGAGNDRLTGGGGADIFVFDTALDGSNNVDLVTDFSVALDTIWLDLDIFSTLNAGALPAEGFFKGAGADAAHAAGHRIVYNTSTGTLYYDADGQGGSDPVPIAILGATTHPQGLGAADFMVVA